MRGRGIQIIVQFLDILAVIALMTCYAEQPLFQNRILAVPKGEGKADALVIIRDARNTILAPPICAGTRLLVREMAPSVAICRVIFADGSLIR
jgi:hypothetical protein